MASTWQKTMVDNSEMPLYLSLPESGAPVPGIVVVHGRSGLEDFIKEYNPEIFFCLSIFQVYSFFFFPY